MEPCRDDVRMPDDGQNMKDAIGIILERLGWSENDIDIATSIVAQPFHSE